MGTSMGLRQALRKQNKKVVEFEKMLEKEKETTDWAVKLQRASRKGRLDELKKKGLIQLELVVDTNVMFSFFWKGSMVKKLLMDQDVLLFAPEFALEEINKYEKEIIRKAKITKKREKELFRKVDGLV